MAMTGQHSLSGDSRGSAMSVSPLPQHPRGDSSPGVLMDQMQDIEHELDGMKNEWAAAESALVRATSEIERIAAPLRLRLKRSNVPAKQGGPTKEDLDAMVLNELWDDHEELMICQVNAEAQVAGFKTIFKVAETTLSSKQSRLKTEREAQTRSAA